jgi:branched-chain amino acid transport system ATP-binding protein
MLTVRNLQAYYGKSHVLHGVDLDVRRGEIVSLLGRNGVGRSTTAKAIMGLVQCTGRIEFKGQDLTRLP